MKWETAIRRQTVVERIIEDDEIVMHGYLHMERMDDDHIWFTIGDRAFDLRAVRGAHGLTLEWTEQGGWPKEDPR